VKNAVKVGLISLGCPKNTVDSEVMLGHLRADGMEITADPDGADVLVVNTCGFIAAAREESIDTILEAARRKQDGTCRRLVVTGCLVHRFQAELAAEIPEIDAFVDLDGITGIRAAVGLDGAGELAAAAPRSLPTLPAAAPATYLYGADTPRLRTTPPWMAYVKIAEGCDNTCAFCAIPRFRGAFRSRPLVDILAEARRLAAVGVA
jgi:ribosomal protein S12 methylthiotransferase